MKRYVISDLSYKKSNVYVRNSYVMKTTHRIHSYYARESTNLFPRFYR